MFTLLNILVFCLVRFHVVADSSLQASVIKARTLSSTRLKKLTESIDYEEFNILLRPILKSRVPGTVGHHAVKEYLIKFFTDLGWEVTQDEFDKNTVIGPKRFTNIVVTANPNAKKFVLLTAHYDSKLMKGNKEFLAASDSAVPVAMMMLIAKSLDLDQLKKKNDYSIQLVFFDGEEAFVQWTSEDSLYGSTHLAELWSQPDGSNINHLSKIEFFVLLDLLGERNPKFYSGFPTTHRYFERLQHIEKRLQKQGSISKENSYFIGGLQPSPLGIQDDHIPFMEKGVSILHIIPLPFPGCWHKFCDNGSNIDRQTVLDLLKIFHTFFKEIMRT